MLKRYWKNIISLVLIVALLVGIFPTTAYAQDNLPTALACETQTGMSSIYEYQPFDIGKAGTVYLNTYQGTPHLRRSDLSLGGTRLPVDLTFYYDPVNVLDINCNEANPYGVGWTSSYSQLLRFDPATRQLAYKNENGTWIYFADSGSTTASGDKLWIENTVFGVGATGAELHLVPGADFTSYESMDIICDGVHHRFDSLGRLTELQSGSDLVLINYVPGSQYKIEEIIDTIGRKYCFDYWSDGAEGTLTLTSCISPSGEAIQNGIVPILIQYGFTNDHLTTVTYNNENTVQYTYDAQGRLTSAANIDGCGYAFAYTGSTISSITAKAAMGTAQEESGNVVTVEKSAKTQTTITDGDLQQKYSFDGCGRITNCELLAKTQETSSYTCIYGFNLTYDYVTDESGVITNAVVGTQAYDINGVIEDPTEPPEETEPEETEETEASNYTETTDSYGNVLTETHTEGELHQTTTYTYSEDGNYLASKTDENGHTETYSYNLGSGLLEALIDGNGNRTEYTYNALRELTSVHLDMDSIQGSTGMEANYTYFEGRLIQLEYGDYLYDFTYDIWGNVLSVTMNSAPLVTYDYGTNASKGMVQTMTYGNGQKVFYTYNALGQVASVGYTGQTNRFQYTYGTDGSLTSILDIYTGAETTYTDAGYEASSAYGGILYAYTSGEGNNYTESINEITYESTVKNQNKDGSTTKTVKNDTGSLVFSASATYDAFNRLTQKCVTEAGVTVDQNYAYTVDENGATGSLVETYTTTYKTALEQQTALSFRYTYDGNGNITGVVKEERTGEAVGIPDPNPPISGYAMQNGSAGVQTTYTYDEAGQLIAASDGETGKTYRYTYDNMGNILTAKVYSVLQDGEEILIDEKTYQYENGILCGIESTVDGNIGYVTDEMGNPLNTGPECLTWGEGRMLTEISHNGGISQYTYNSDGLRIAKTVTDNGITTVTEYVWGDNGLTAAITDAQLVVVLYDAEGESVGFSVNGVVYTYVKNLQGDVLRVLDGTGTAVVSYTYDPWGVPTVSGDTDLAALNPCSYRSYYYDQETGYYYLQSRYYDPNIGRFLNADGVEYLNSSENLISGNLFTYCNNAPIASSDPNGHEALLIAGATIYISVDLVLVVCAFLLLIYVITYRRQIKQMIAQLISSLRALASALSTVVKNALKNSKLRRNVVHHIVAKAAGRASIARYYLTDRNHGNISVNASLNLISINERFHRHLHTNAYYDAVNALLRLGNKKVGVIAAMCLIRAVLWAVNRRFF